MEPKVQLFFWHLEPENAWFDNEAIIHMQRLTTQFVRKKIMHSEQFELSKSAKYFLRYVKKC